MKKIVANTLLMLALTLVAVGQQTVYLPAFTNSATASGVYQVTKNINQTAHWLTCLANGSNTGTATAGLYGSFDGASYFLISQAGQITFPGVQLNLQASGYYPYIQARYTGLAGVGAAISCSYAGSVGPIPLPQNIGLTAPTSDLVTQQPAFINQTQQKSAATQASYPTGAQQSVLGLYAINPSGTVVYVAIYSTNALTNPTTSPMVLQVPANGTASYPIPQTGVNLGGTTLYSYCSTSLTSLADPASNCVITLMYKPVVGVAPN